MLKTVEAKSQIIEQRYYQINHHLLSKVGNTPLIELKNMSQDLNPVRVYAKAEWFNPGGSIKDRAALNMISQGIRSGKLDKSKIILDASSGNTGIAYAMIAAILGYNVLLCIPENAGIMHKNMLHAYGAQLIFTDPLLGSDGAIVAAQELYANHPEKYFYVDQYNNENNWKAHYNGTGLEIIRQTGGEVTHFVAGLGSTGTFVGTGRRLKKYNPDIKLISCQPDSPLHGMEGMKHLETAKIPGIYDSALADENIEVTTEEAQEMVLRLAQMEGVLVGNSAGAAMACAVRVAKRISTGKIVVIFPDNANKYLEQAFWKEKSYDN